MKPQKFIIIFLAIFILIILIYFLIPKNKYNLEGFSQCLNSQKVELYGAYWCSYCQKQKEILGDLFKEINYIECSEKKEECQKAGITGLPTWRINGQNIPGVISLEKLSLLSACPLGK